MRSRGLVHRCRGYNAMDTGGWGWWAARWRSSLRRAALGVGGRERKLVEGGWALVNRSANPCVPCVAPCPYRALLCLRTRVLAPSALHDAAADTCAGFGCTLWGPRLGRRSAPSPMTCSSRRAWTSSAWPPHAGARRRRQSTGAAVTGMVGGGGSGSCRRRCPCHQCRGCPFPPPLCVKGLAEGRWGVQDGFRPAGSRPWRGRPPATAACRPGDEPVGGGAGGGRVEWRLVVTAPPVEHNWGGVG